MNKPNPIPYGYHTITPYLTVRDADKLEEYQGIATLASQIWKEHGALEYIEAAGDDLKPCMPDAKAPTELRAPHSPIPKQSLSVYETHHSLPLVRW